jgi:hypothetical protein
MPLNEKGRKILAAMRKKYGERAEQVFYSSKNAGTITGIDSAPEVFPKGRDPEALLKAAEDELEALGKEQEQVVARQGAIDDRAMIMRRLRDEMREDTDVVGDVVRLERAQELVRHIGDAITELTKRIDEFAQR